MTLQAELGRVARGLGKGLRYEVADDAPGTYAALVARRSAGALVVYAGASECTLYGAPQTNWLMRALHDRDHTLLGLSFRFEHEREAGRIMASRFDGVLADAVYADFVGQIDYFATHGKFVEDQLGFVLSKLSL